MRRLRITWENESVDIGYWLEKKSGLQKTDDKITIRARDVTRLIVALQRFHQNVSGQQARVLVK